MEKEIKVGDRVYYSVDGHWEHIRGKVGTVVKDRVIEDKDLLNSLVRFAVEWDEYNNHYHDCGGICKHGYGYNVDLKGLELFSSLKEIDVGDLEDDL